MVPLLAAEKKAPFLVHPKQILDPSYFVSDLVTEKQLAVGNSTFFNSTYSFRRNFYALWLIQFLNIVHAFCHVLVTTLGTVKSIIEFYAIFEHGQKYVTKFKNYWTLQKNQIFWTSRWIRRHSHLFLNV